VWLHCRRSLIPNTRYEIIGLTRAAGVREIANDNKKQETEQAEVICRQKGQRTVMFVRSSWKIRSPLASGQFILQDGCVVFGRIYEYHNSGHYASFFLLNTTIRRLDSISMFRCPRVEAGKNTSTLILYLCVPCGCRSKQHLVVALCSGHVMFPVRCGLNPYIRFR
jgi:hypothetical protein